jgi:DNA modification methylase
MQKRITWKIEKRKLADLKPHSKNPRVFTDKGMKDLENSINSIGFMQPININQDGTILSGHARAMKLKELGDTEVDVYVPDRMLTPKQEEEVLVRANANTAGQWDWDLLANNFELEEINEWGLEVPDMNITTEELEAKEDDFDGEPPAEPITVLGDLYEIGEHRLLCGDSTCSDSVAKLMDGKKADMVFTDPPYGIKVVKSEMVGANFGIAKKGKYSQIIADDTTETAKKFYNTCISLGMNNFIIWGGNYFTDFLPFSDGWLIWNKRAGTDIRNTFADGEMAWCSFHTPIRIYDQLWNGMIREGEKDKRVHPTQKPIRMLSEIIRDHIRENLIFDGFLGSGSILVASHQLKRKCYGMELDPKYCDVIIRRMIKLDPSLTITRNGEDCKNEFIEKND